MYAPSAPSEAFMGFIHQYSRFFVVGHKEPDGDCVGSQLALCSALRRLGKEAAACQAGPFKRGEVCRYEPFFLSNIPAERENTALIIVDCTGIDRIGELEKDCAALPLAIIDHHATGSAAGAAAAYIDLNAPATVLLIHTLITTLGLSVTREEAAWLFLGLCTDTGFFRHLDSSSACVLSMASELVRAGASPKDTFAAMHGGKSLESRLLLGAILSRVTPYFGGKLLLSTEEMAETERYGLEGRDSDSLYQLLTAVRGVEAVAVLREESAENCTAGFRSTGRIDVSRIAAALGGGGHKNAAGALFQGSLAQLREAALALFEKAFPAEPQ
jgi:phosphoesterase RecJ-like protein